VGGIREDTLVGGGGLGSPSDTNNRRPARAAGFQTARKGD